MFKHVAESAAEGFDVPVAPNWKSTAADRRDITAVAEQLVGLPELPHDLLRRMPLPVRHDLPGLPARNRGRPDDSPNNRTE